jgi:hypothetical protein
VKCTGFSPYTKNATFEGFTGCGKTLVWYQGTTLHAAEKLGIGAKSIPQGLNRLRKNALYEGHGFSRAANAMLATRLLAAEVRFDGRLGIEKTYRRG